MSSIKDKISVNSNEDDALSVSTDHNKDIKFIPPKTLQDPPGHLYPDDGFEDVDLHDDDVLDETSADILSIDIEHGEAPRLEHDDEYSVETHKDQALERKNSIATLLLTTLQEDGLEILLFDPRLSRRARDFAFARSERAAHGPKPDGRGFFNLFSELALVRADLQWAEDASWRRENRQPYLRWGDYEKERNKRSWKRPYLTYSILAVQLGVMIYEFSLSNWTTVSFKENPMFGPSGDVLVEAGGLNALVMVQTGSWYRLVSSTFLHAGVFHYLMNGVYIYCFGSLIERNHGMACLSLVYFLPSVAANVVAAVLNPGPTSVGASGGVYGLVGASIADLMMNWSLMFLIFKDHPELSKFWFKVKCTIYVIIDLAFHLGVGLIPLIDNFAHIGGFVYGFLAAFIVMERLPLAFFGKGGKCKTYRSWLFRFLAAILMAFAIASTSVKLSQSDGKTVPYPSVNRYISCVELPFWKEDKWWYCDECSTSAFQIFEHETETNTNNIFDKTITKIKFECPDGSEVIGDVAEFKYDDLGQFSSNDVVGVCHKVC